MTNKKSNKALRAALVLCVLALFCAAFVGATFAKYVTADDASDTARAANWGVSVSIGGKLFGAHYEKNVGVTETDDKVAVSSTNVAAVDGLADIVAPGTKADKGIIIELKGTPEVEYKIEAATVGTIEDIYLGAGTWGTMVPVNGLTDDIFDTTTDKYYVFDGTNFTLADETALDDSTTVIYELHDEVTLGAAYYPLIWSVTNEGTEDTMAIASSTNANGLTAVSTALVDALNDNRIDGVANNELDAKYTLTWAWAYEGQNDDADTILGNLIAGAENAIVVSIDGTTITKAADDNNCNLQVSFGIEVTATQVN